MSTLLKNNYTYDYFINWEKVYSNLQEYEVEISILNTLSHIEENNRSEKLSELLVHYPRISTILPLIIGIRQDSIDIFDQYKKTFKKFIFNETHTTNDLIKFCEKTGIFKLFNHINDLNSYLIGLESGLDTNARKNRSGQIFKKLIEDIIDSNLENYPSYTISNKKYIPDLDIKTNFDFIITDKNNTPKIAIKCNFYNSSGSKAKSVSNSYLESQKILKNNDIKFVWVTDGYNWKKMESLIIDSSRYMDYVLNYDLLDKNLDKIFENILKEDSKWRIN
ncbi:MAG: DpnII family type II restriction endonuclease [Methanobacteriaceae archaeon]|nr:DpnII family type II restriction endonuclease [Methanobacteriaceae archaeon]